MSNIDSRNNLYTLSSLGLATLWVQSEGHLTLLELRSHRKDDVTSGPIPGA